MNGDKSNLVDDQVVPWIEVLLHTLIDWMRTEGEEGREVNHYFGSTKYSHLGKR